VSNNSGECSAPPFSGVVGSGRGCGVNVSSRSNRAGFTGTQRVLVSAVPSASVGGPASVLGGPGIEGWFSMGLAPAGQIHRRVAVAIGRMSTTTAEHAVSQRQLCVNGPAGWAQLTGGIPAIRDDHLAVPPLLLVAQ
jgi:hypothetical protein